VNDPDVVFLDEPTTGLDPQARRRFWELIRSVNQEGGKTIILTTHYLEEAELLSDRVAIIDHGRIQASTPRRGSSAASRALLASGSPRRTEWISRSLGLCQVW
jgi:ABC-2 type transport system ATP-binding protein